MTLQNELIIDLLINSNEICHFLIQQVETQSRGNKKSIHYFLRKFKICLIRIHNNTQKSFKLFFSKYFPIKVQISPSGCMKFIIRLSCFKFLIFITEAYPLMNIIQHLQQIDHIVIQKAKTHKFLTQHQSNLQLRILETKLLILIPACSFYSINFIGWKRSGGDSKIDQQYQNKIQKAIYLQFIIYLINIPKNILLENPIEIQLLVIKQVWYQNQNFQEIKNLLSIYIEIPLVVQRFIWQYQISSSLVFDQFSAYNSCSYDNQNYLILQSREMLQTKFLFTVSLLAFLFNEHDPIKII
ncbi:hypothetical protein pb186bvf_003830 [Paramecium bursaria]